MREYVLRHRPTRLDHLHALVSSQRAQFLPTLWIKRVICFALKISDAFLANVFRFGANMVSSRHVCVYTLLALCVQPARCGDA